jgi:hypothetical protein
MTETISSPWDDETLTPEHFADIMAEIVNQAFVSKNIIEGYKEGLRLVFFTMRSHGYDLTDFLRLKEWNGEDG